MASLLLPSLGSGITNTADGDACYLALKTRDARFDGRFFTGVTSTGIYCRPVCKVRTPKRENCVFFEVPAQAEHAGFRPCMRCRPELAPARLGHEVTAAWSSHSASTVLAQQAARLLDQASAWCDGAPSATALAQRLGVSERHLRRIFEAHWGVTPLQYLQTRRLLQAKQLLTDTALPVAQVAALSGFSSVRRFNACFLAHYRMQPSVLRRAPRPTAQSAPAVPDAIALRACYRPPYDVGSMLRFFSTRCIGGVEHVDLQERSFSRTIAIAHQGSRHTGWVKAQFEDDNHAVRLLISQSLSPVVSLVAGRLRELLDLDADPLPIDAQLAPYFPQSAGLRVPGTLDGFELAVRAILGQQITVAAARTLAQRMVEQLGTSVATPFAQLSRCFPDAHTVARTPAETLGAMGIVRQRQRAIHALANAVAHGNLVLDATAPVAATLEQLQALPGIGAWTANYIAMRALRWPDAFPSADVALHTALGVRAHAHPAQEAERIAQAWRPWRSYGVLRAWAGTGERPIPPATPTPPRGGPR